MSEREFAWPPAYRAQESWPELLTLVASIATEIGRKNVASDLDLSKSYLNNVLADRERHNLKARELLYFILRDERVLEWLAKFAGYEIEKVQPLTPEQELAQLKKRIRTELGPVGLRLLGETPSVDELERNGGGR